MTLCPYPHQIEIGCDDWDEPWVLGRGSVKPAFSTQSENFETAPPDELLGIDHHAVLEQTLAEFIATRGRAETPNTASSDTDQPAPTELSLYFTSSRHIRQINFDYRGKDKATNVLSFESELPAQILSELDYRPLGELVFCLEVITQEAADQGKTLADHYTHLLVHGCLHLLGLDHETSEADQAQMEALEIKILKRLGIADPYAGL